MDVVLSDAAINLLLLSHLVPNPAESRHFVQACDGERAWPFGGPLQPSAQPQALRLLAGTSALGTHGFVALCHGIACEHHGIMDAHCSVLHVLLQMLGAAYNETNSC
jgi:hypothetical protein